MHLEDYSHRRYNILTGEWVLVSPHRAKRPWQGQEEEALPEVRSSFDPDCYLCPGNTRAGGKTNPNYKGVYVFENDFAALQMEVPTFDNRHGLLQYESEMGRCKVICYSPDHSKSMADLDIEELLAVVAIWQQQYELLMAEEAIHYVQIFENKGAVMGCSNPHPHGQIWAQQRLPNEVIKKQNQQWAHFMKHGVSLLEDYVEEELEAGQRILFENKTMLVLIPFWAVWPFEVMILPKKQQGHIMEMNSAHREDFVEALSKTTKMYDKIFGCSFPYSAGIHQSPKTEKALCWHWHMSFYPPLLRSASVKKFMVGYEMFGMPQRDITAEVAAERMRELI
ncbi:MAG: UDP-glucose--hexose-1-phosphate uridylyltransferase [Flavobacteriaceae bacterium]|nr:UDP-glucose--hexose-1-phosphate uridylyltransferase [Flavobacteriaceae bacterium]